MSVVARSVAVALAWTLIGGACRTRAPTPPELTAGDARRIADATIQGRSGELRYHYTGIHDNGPAFLVHYAIERPCGERRPSPEPEAADGLGPDRDSRAFTAVVDLCPTGSPGGATIEVLKADGRARAISGE